MLSAILACALIALTVEAAAASAAGPEPVTASESFKLPASNGYSLRVVAFARGVLGQGVVLLIAERKGASVTYATPATVTRTSVQADLGALGQIDVDFHPSGKVKREHSACSRRQVPFDAGFYEGTIDFAGEGGYARASATRAEADIRFFLDVVCPGNGGVSGTGPGLPGAALTARSLGSPERIRLEVGKNTPGSRTRLSAGVVERRAGIVIERGIETIAPPGAFDYDHRLTTATVRPPAPFSGSATFHRGAAPPQRWTGNLSLDFPGRTDVSLTGDSFHVGMYRARWESLGP